MNGPCHLCGEETETFATVYPLQGYFCGPCISSWPDPLDVLYEFALKIGSPLAADVPA